MTASASNVGFHFTPKGSSWINRTESVRHIMRQAIRRCFLDSLAELITTMDTYIGSWNEDTVPLEWTATVDEIIAKVALLDRVYRKLVTRTRQ